MKIVYIFLALIFPCMAGALPSDVFIEVHIRDSGDVYLKLINNSDEAIVLDRRVVNTRIAVRMWLMSGVSLREVPRFPMPPLRPISRDDYFVVLANESRVLGCGNVFNGFGGRLRAGEFILIYTYSSDHDTDGSPNRFLTYFRAATSVIIDGESESLSFSEVGPSIRRTVEPMGERDEPTGQP